MCILIVPQQNTRFILDSDMERKNEESYKFPIAVQQMFMVIQIQALAVIGGLQIQACIGGLQIQACFTKNCIARIYLE
ncbi:hypothetical protein Tco_0023165, partial [Tanacetum coccineum]